MLFRSDESRKAARDFRLGLESLIAQGKADGTVKPGAAEVWAAVWLGVVTVLGNHDRYTGEREVVRGVREAGQVFVKNGAHVIERNGAVLALLGIDDPRNWKMDDPQPDDVRAALAAAPPQAFKILLAHRPGA